MVGVKQSDLERRGDTAVSYASSKWVSHFLIKFWHCIIQAILIALDEGVQKWYDRQWNSDFRDESQDLQQELGIIISANDYVVQM